MKDENQVENLTVEIDKVTLEKIAGSISCGTIAEGKIKKPFEFGGKLYVGTSGRSTGAKGHSEVCAYRVVPESEFAGKTYLYSEKPIRNDRNRETFYDGVRVRQGKNSYVLQSPVIKFVPAEIADGQSKETVDAEDFETPTDKQIRYHREAVKAAERREAEKNLKAPETVKAVTVFADTVIPIRISEITPSPLEPQAMRRETFKPEDIDSLGKSILKHGLQEPILVRPVGGGSYEIVFGELRWLAVQAIGIETINCFVREVSDAKALELQYEENHRRHQNTPLIDASYFKVLKEKEGYSNEELADRLNTSTANVTNKLILNNLIDAAKDELKRGLLPLKHAYFLARFPAETQELICKEQYAYKYYDRTEKATSFKSFVEEVEENITRKLANAPFSTTDPRLHIQGLICPDCPQRTGYAPSLFTDLSAEDSCLNKSCFEIKTNTNLRLQRDAIAAQRPNPTNIPIEEIAKDVPLVTDRDWTDKKVLGEKPLTKQEFLPEPECEFSEISLIVEGSRKGQSTYICREKACAVHNPQPPAPDLTDAAFVRRVELLTREKVLAKSLEAFSDYKPIWMYDDLVQKLIVELWIGKGVEAQKSIMRIVRDWKELPKAFYSRGEVDSFVRSLDKTKQSQIIFLLLFHLNTSTDEIKKISDDYARLDYRILEAEARLELAPESEKELAQDILTITKAGVNDLRKPDFDLDAVH